MRADMETLDRASAGGRTTWAQSAS